MESIIRYKIQVKRLDALTGIPFDKKNQEHEKKLQRLWDNLMPGKVLKGRLTEQWIEIGFQGKDPATDFRGAGILGLD